MKMNKKNLNEILGNPENFLKKIFANLEKDKINFSNYVLDHICYRVESLERYDKIKKYLLEIGYLLLENEVGGRLIAKIKLNEPIIFQDRKISLIELPQPNNAIFSEGFEHVEFVILESFDDFMKKYKNLKFNISGINKEINPDIVKKYDDFCVKFHHKSLEYVVKYLEK